MYTDKFWKRFYDRTSQPVALTLLKSLEGTCPTVMLMLCQCCHDVRTTCITIMICVLGDVVYITWGTSGHGDHLGGEDPSGGDGAPN